MLAVRYEKITRPEDVFISERYFRGLARLCVGQAVSKTGEHGHKWVAVLGKHDALIGIFVGAVIIKQPLEICCDSRMKWLSQRLSLILNEFLIVRRVKRVFAE
ncbi:hypothetical protein D3C78_1359490 [compost metagenome]